MGTLEFKVNQHIDIGYEPVGGVVNTDRAYSRYLQAVFLPSKLSHFIRSEDDGSNEELISTEVSL
jgi:hypothetical protein